ncbi:MAG: N-acetyltransferase family protein [Bacteroidia bacterium]
MTLHEFNSPSGKHVVIRKAERSDAPAIIDYSTHILSTFTDVVLTLPDEFHPSVTEQEKWIDLHNTSETGFLALAECDGKLTGMIHFLSGPKKRVLHVGEFALSVREGFHGHKIGTTLLQCLIGWAKANPVIEKIILNVSPSNDNALHIYKKLGFIQEGYNIKALKQPDGRFTDNIQMALFV